MPKGVSDQEELLHSESPGAYQRTHKGSSEMPRRKERYSDPYRRGTTALKSQPNKIPLLANKPQRRATLQNLPLSWRNSAHDSAAFL